MKDLLKSIMLVIPTGNLTRHINSKQPELKKHILSKTKHLKDFVFSNRNSYDFLNDITHIKKCIYCGSPLVFQRFSKGYGWTKFCNFKCQKKAKNIKITNIDELKNWYFENKDNIISGHDFKKIFSDNLLEDFKKIRNRNKTISNKIILKLYLMGFDSQPVNILGNNIEIFDDLTFNYDDIFGDYVVNKLKTDAIYNKHDFLIYLEQFYNKYDKKNKLSISGAIASLKYNHVMLNNTIQYYHDNFDHGGRYIKTIILCLFNNFNESPKCHICDKEIIFNRETKKFDKYMCTDICDGHLKNLKAELKDKDFYIPHMYDINKRSHGPGWRTVKHIFPELYIKFKSYEDFYCWMNNTTSKQCSECGRKLRFYIKDNKYSYRCKGICDGYYINKIKDNNYTKIDDNIVREKLLKIKDNVIKSHKLTLKKFLTTDEWISYYLFIRDSGIIFNNLAEKFFYFLYPHKINYCRLCGEKGYFNNFVKGYRDYCLACFKEETKTLSSTGEKEVTEFIKKHATNVIENIKGIVGKK